MDTAAPAKTACISVKTGSGKRRFQEECVAELPVDRKGGKNMTEQELRECVNQMEGLPEEFQDETPDQVLLYDWNGGVLNETE